MAPAVTNEPRSVNAVRVGEPEPPRHAAARIRPGLSLLELLIALTVLAIVAALVIPMGGHVATTRLRNAARRLVADLEYAQIESMTHGDEPRVVVFDPTAGSYRIASTLDPLTPLTHHLSGQPMAVQFGAGRTSELKGVTIVNLSLDGDDQLGFGPYGQLDQTTPATITLGAGSRTITITLNPDTGEASVGPIQ